MFHSTEVQRAGPSVKVRSIRRGFQAGIACGLALGLLSACESDATAPTPGLFGQTGQVQVEVQHALGDGQGILQESLIWRSTGPWLLTERVSLRGVQGGETLRRSRLNPGELATEYAELIRRLNETEGVRLLGGEVSQEVSPLPCPAPRVRVSVSIRDEARNEFARWDRCTAGSLFDFEPGQAGPDAEAERVVAAAELIRSFTLGTEPTSTYAGTLPFATLEIGEHSPALPTGPRAFVSDTGNPPETFREFWAAHAGQDASLPTQVNWGEEIVILVAVGERDEAGNDLQVKRVLPSQGFLRVEAVRRERGDFCAPAKVRVHPFHLVIVPAGTGPVEFVSPDVERIPCG